MHAIAVPPISAARWTRWLCAALMMGLPMAIVSAAESPGMAARAAAASAAAQSDRNACAPIRPFYWEIGDARGVLAAGSVERARHSGAPTYTADSAMAIASASKWLFAAYVVQREQGRLTPAQISLLNFTSGYTHFRFCLRRQSVDECLRFWRNGEYDPATAGRFFYNGGHLEKLAQQLGLGPLDDAGLTAAMQGQLGRNIALSYSQPQLAGGVATTPGDYARFLRKLMTGQLLLGHMLDADAVCANPATCPSKALHSPVPIDRTWHYGLGHWIEDDPKSGDGAYSSAGAFGFYPWIDASRRWYGIVARRAGFGAGVASADCGALIRKAWLDAAPL